MQGKRWHSSFGNSAVQAAPHRGFVLTHGGWESAARSWQPRIKYSKQSCKPQFTIPTLASRREGKFLSSRVVWTVYQRTFKVLTLGNPPRSWGAACFPLPPQSNQALDSRPPPKQVSQVCSNAGRNKRNDRETMLTKSFHPRLLHPSSRLSFPPAPLFPIVTISNTCKISN